MKVEGGGNGDGRVEERIGGLLMVGILVTDIECKSNV